MSQSKPVSQVLASIIPELADYAQRWNRGFQSFWFQPRRPDVLGLIRLLLGMVLVYTHLAWTFELSAFIGSDGLLPPQYRELLLADAAWSHLDWCGDGAALWIVHGLGVLVLVLFMIGCWTQITSILAALLVISYGNRTLGAGFGLDQINAFLCLYCAVGNSGGSWSLDRWYRNRKRDQTAGTSFPWVAAADTRTNIGIRLIQVHMCVVYLFAALGKLQGDTWWTGEAVWLAMASYEYQTLDMTWLANFMPLVSLMTVVSLFWELGYAALIWPRLTRPIMLAIAVPVHLGIGLCMGMLSFGLVMLIGNLAFIELKPERDSEKALVS